MLGQYDDFMGKFFSEPPVKRFAIKKCFIFRIMQLDVTLNHNLLKKCYKSVIRE